MRKTSAAPLDLHVTLRWREDVLAFRRLTGEASLTAEGMAPIPGAAAVSGVAARVSRGAASAVVAAEAVATIARADGRLELFEGPCEVPLAAGDALELRLGDFRFEALAGAPEVLPASARRRPAGALAGFALAALAHAVIFGLAAQDARAASAEARGDERTEDLRGLLATAEQRARAVEARVEDAGGIGEGKPQSSRPGDGRRGGGARAAGEEGSMGDRLATGKTHRRYAVPEELKRDASPETARAEALADASAFGMIGLLAQGPATLSAPFGDDWAHGTDAIAARGDLWGRESGASFGAGGLGLAGIGEGGGGRGEGIGLGMIGTLGHADGRAGGGTGGDGSATGMVGWGVAGGQSSRGFGRLSGTHHARPPRVCMCGGTMVSGRLPPEAVQRVVRQNFGRFRACYENGLGRNPALEGTVRARFVIGRDGAVAESADGGSTMADPTVVSCVARAFSGLSFPQPEGGIVTVTYPIAFSPE